jgi:hypothetical protein
MFVCTTPESAALNHGNILIYKIIYQSSACFIFSFFDQVKLTIKLTSSEDPIGLYAILKQITNLEKRK